MGNIDVVLHQASQPRCLIDSPSLQQHPLPLLSVSAVPNERLSCVWAVYLRICNTIHEAKCSPYLFEVCSSPTDKPWNRAIHLYWYISMTMAYYDQCMLALVSFDGGLWSFSYPHRSTLCSSFCSPVAAVEIQ
jgi:hypothetical protein